MSDLHLALAQIDTVLGNVQSNLEKHLLIVEQAEAAGADLLVFPELSLTGYGLRDLVPDVAMHANPAEPTFAKLLQASQSIDLLVGFVEEDERHRFFISAAYLAAGEIVHIHRKAYLPTYGLFEEGRFLAWGDQVRAFNTRFGRIGVLICEDFWHASLPYLLWMDGADVMLFISASPSRGLSDARQLSSVAWVERINQAYASLFTSFVAHTNRIGFEDGLKFGGRATVFDPNGELIEHGPYHEESITYSTLDLAQLRRTRLRLPLLRDERTSLVEHELRRILAKDTNGLGSRKGPQGDTGQ
ncbi:MAG: nitrilase-related carbon-nitrogen hydrolase [Anaerolineales bacterium]